MSTIGARFPFSAVVGQSDLRLALELLAVDPGIGGLLIRGHKGTAKTTAVRALAGLVPSAPSASPPENTPHDGPPAPFVELPLGATEDRVVGSLDLDELAARGVPKFRPGLLGSADGGMLYVDEVNLLADHLVDVLLDAAATGRLTVERDGVSHTAPARFALVGTMNPEEGELRPQLLDRFGLAVDVVGSADPAERVEIIRRRRGYEADPEAFAAAYAADDAELARRIAVARELLPSVEVPDRELERIALLCIAVGVEGMRADVVIARTAAAHAALEGRTVVTEDDVRAAATFALPHRRRRDPFDPAEMDPGELDEALDSARDQLGPADPEQGDDDPDPDDDPDGGGPGGGEPDDSPPEPPQPAGDGATGAAAADDSADGAAEDTADESSDGASDTPAPAGRQVAPDETRASARPLALTVSGRGRGATGRRSAAETQTGRLVSAPRSHDSAQLHLLDTFRAALVRRLPGDDQTPLTPDDLRFGVHRGREGNLVVFLVDTSGSMAARRRLDLVTGSCVALLRDAYVRRDLVAVVRANGTTAETAVPPTRSVDAAVRRLARVETGGRTPLAEGLTEVARLLERHRRTDPDRRALLVVLTDGRATAGHDAHARALAAADQVRRRKLAASVVVDCEAGRIRLGGAAHLASALGADLLPLDGLGESGLTRVVRAAA